MSKKDLISDLFFVITTSNWRNLASRIPRARYTAVSGKRGSRKGFRPPRHRMDGRRQRERPDHSGTFRSPNSCRSPLNRDFPESRKPRSSGRVTLKTAAWAGPPLMLASLQTSCPGWSGHSQKVILDPAYSQLCATPLFRRNVRGFSAGDGMHGNEIAWDAI